MMHPVDYSPSQDFGDNPTSILPASHWIIKQFGNYQPDGHTGTDYPCPVGTQVKAVTAGTVLHVGWYSGTYADNPYWISPGFAGYCYVVDHGSSIGIYGHCMDGGNWVNVGAKVREGQTLGLSGNTGASTGPHLHFEALPDGFVLNSYMYGRINPAALFIGALSYAGGTTIPQEDELSAAEVDAITAETNKQKEDLKKQLFEKIDAAVLNLRQHEDDTENATRNYLKDRIVESSPAEVAMQINAAGVAKEVQAELLKLIGGK